MKTIIWNKCRRKRKYRLEDTTRWTKEHAEEIRGKKLYPLCGKS